MERITVSSRSLAERCVVSTWSCQNQLDQQGNGGGGKTTIPFHKADGHKQEEDADEADEASEEGRV